MFRYILILLVIGAVLFNFLGIWGIIVAILVFSLAFIFIIKKLKRQEEQERERKDRVYKLMTEMTLRNELRHFEQEAEKRKKLSPEELEVYNREQDEKRSKREEDNRQKDEERKRLNKEKQGQAAEKRRQKDEEQKKIKAEKERDRKEHQNFSIATIETKYCAVCEYWDGQREVSNISRNQVKYHRHNSARCRKPGTNISGESRGPTQTCSASWRKWSMLR